MSIAIASASSRSAGPWACRRPPTTTAPRGERSARTVEDERLLAVIRETHKANYEAYGYRRTWKALRRAGETAPRCQVQRLMRAHGIQGAKRRGKPWRTTTRTRPPPGARDLVKRDFTASAPEPLVGRRFHVSALLGGRSSLQLRDRRVQPPDRRLAARGPHAHRPRARRAADGARDPASPALTSSSSPIPMPALNTRALTTRRSSTTTSVLASVGIGRRRLDNAMAEASSTASRPS